MNCFSVVMLIVFSVLQLAAIALGIAAAGLPQWLDPEPREIIVKDRTVSIQNAGLWQVCIGSERNSTAINVFKDGEAIADNTKNSFNQMTSDECKTGNLVEDFYKSKAYFTESQYTLFLVTRGLVIIFVLFAVIKLISVWVIKCREEKAGLCSQCWLGIGNFIEGAAATGALITFGLIVQAAQDGDITSDGDVRDYWGIAYQMFLAAGVLAIVANFAICCV